MQQTRLTWLEAVERTSTRPSRCFVRLQSSAGEKPHHVEGLLRGEALLARTLDAVRGVLEAKALSLQRMAG